MILPWFLFHNLARQLDDWDFKSEVSLIHLENIPSNSFSASQTCQDWPSGGRACFGFASNWLCQELSMQDLEICGLFTFSIKSHLVVLACFLRLCSPAGNHPTSCWNCCNVVNPQPLKKRPPHAVSLHTLTIRAKFLSAWDFPRIKYTHTHLNTLKIDFLK